MHNHPGLKTELKKNAVPLSPEIGPLAASDKQRPKVLSCAIPSWLRHLAVTAIAFTVLMQGAAEAVAKQPNVLLIVSDDLGYSDLGCYGGEIETPNLDRLATKGVRFTQFHTTSRCCPSRASLLTGYYPHRVGLGHMTIDLERPGYRGHVAVNVPTIAELLTSSGYRTFISGKWHLGTPDPTQHGFEEFYGTLASAKTFWDPDHYLRMPAGQPKRKPSSRPFYGTDALTDHALEFLGLARQTPDRPWFLYLAYNAPHFPLQARQEDVQKYKRDYHLGWDQLRRQRLRRMRQLGLISEQTELSPRSRFWNYGETRTGINPPWTSLPAARRADLERRMAIYAAMVDRMDQNIGRVLADLREQDELDSTMVLFVSDNGACAEWDPFGFDIKSSNQNILHEGERLETMGQPGTFHSVGSGWANASNTPFRLYKHYCHQGGILSPCIVHWPERLQKNAGALCSVPAHLIDILPTVLKAAGTAEVAASTKVQTPDRPGRDLIALIDNDRPAERALFFEHEGNRAVRRGNWKLVALRDRPWELYDLQKDPTELTDLATQQPQKVSELAERWDRWATANNVTPLPTDYGVNYIRSTATPPTLKN